MPERPDRCTCDEWRDESDHDLPCPVCALHGFDSANPETGEDINA